ncbi:MAG: hypothetical protein V2I33_17625, partial [Kangiellaceae bacterium]|nr:hypothetical protein [Kangiellaceae bacterium]
MSIDNVRLKVIVPLHFLIILTLSLVIRFLYQRFTDRLSLLELVLELLLCSFVIIVKPVLCFLNCLGDGLLILLTELFRELLAVVDAIARGVDVRLQGVSCVDSGLRFFILLGELLSLADHTVNLLLGESSLVVGDR